MVEIDHLEAHFFSVFQLILRLPKESTTQMLKDAVYKKTGVSPRNVSVCNGFFLSNSEVEDKQLYDNAVV